MYVYKRKTLAAILLVAVWSSSKAYKNLDVLCVVVYSCGGFGFLGVGFACVGSVVVF